MEFAERLNELLEEKDITAYRLAKDTGISNGIISAWRHSEKLPAADNLKKLADYFAVSTDYLLGRTEHVGPPGRGAIQQVREDYRDTGFYERLLEICNEKGRQLVELLETLSIDPSHLVQWRAGILPEEGTVHLLAQALEISANVLWGDLQDDYRVMAAHYEGEGMGPLTEEELEELTRYLEFIRTKKRE